MCAIFGIIGKSDIGLLKKMSKCQIYRGPDTQSFYINKKNKISLGMNRLAVIDKKKGHQPMFSHDKRYLLIFNGTIYNFLDLKKFLIRKIRFNTNSDTEVLLYLYEEKGEDFVKLLNGIFSFVIYDKKKDTLFR